LRLSARCFVQALQSMAAKSDAESARACARALGANAGGGTGYRTAAGDLQGGLDETLEREGEGLTEADAWLKTLECVVETLPPPPKATPEAGEEDDGSARGVARQAAVACESECALLVEKLLLSTAHASEAVTAIILRALGIFSQLYNRAPDQLIGAVVVSILESISGRGASGGADASRPMLQQRAPSDDGAARRRICIGVLHKIASACGAKLAVHIDEIRTLICRILQQLPPDAQGTMTGVFFVCSFTSFLLCKHAPSARVS